MKRILVIFVALLVAVGATVAYLWLTQPHTPAAPEVAEPQPPPAKAEPPKVNLEEGEALLKKLGAGLSKNETFARWLTEKDLLRRLTAAVNQIAEGESPRTMLDFLAPGGAFEVTEPPRKKGKKKKGKAKPEVITATAKTYARYDKVTEVVTSVDPVALGKAYGELRLYTEAAFREVGKPDQKFDAQLRKAIAHLLAAPALEAPPELREDGIIWKYKDDKLESLSKAQKHLLRMGPGNEAQIQKWLKALEAALPPAGAPPAAAADGGA